MADVQKEHGHVDIANGIVEALAKTHLSSYESQVFMGTINFTTPTEEFLEATSTSDFCKIIFCPYCGASSYISFKFCWQCGKEILKGENSCQPT